MSAWFYMEKIFYGLLHSLMEKKYQGENKYYIFSYSYFPEQARGMLNILMDAKSDQEKILAINEALNQAHHVGNVLGGEYNALRKEMDRSGSIRDLDVRDPEPSPEVEDAPANIKHRFTKKWNPNRGDEVKVKPHVTKDFPEEFEQGSQYIIKDVRPDMVQLKEIKEGPRWWPIRFFTATR